MKTLNDLILKTRLPISTLIDMAVVVVLRLFG
jgi:hypothetical protein